MWAERSRSTDLVGRDGELSTLRELVRGDGGPRSAAVVLGGDAGVGKTRLLGELAQGLADEGRRVLLGHCLDFGDTAMPYLPFTEMFRRLGQAEPALGAELASAHPALAELTRSKRGGADGSAPSDGPSDALERAEIFASTHALLEDLAVRGPLVVVVEDAHWADGSSRDLISFLLARGFASPVSLVVSYRSDDLHRRHPLRAAVAEWTRIPSVARLQLAPLSNADVHRMVVALTGGAEEPAHAEDIERIVQRAGGNPFYAEELVGAFLSGGWTLPEDLADLLLVRLDRLEESTRTLVREAAVAGQRVPHDLLAAVSTLTGRDFEHALRSALDQHVLVRVGEHDYAFRHALLGEAVYDDLLPGERLRLHTAYAAAIRDRLGGASPGALARHAYASHDLSTALAASVEAGRLAMDVGGPDEAARHFQTALELHPRVVREAGEGGGPVEDGRPPLPDIAELVVEASEALAVSGHPDRALALVSAQLDELPADAHPHRRARLLLAMAEAAWMTESKVDLMATTSAGLALAEDAPRLRARLLAAHAWSHIVDNDTAAAQATAEQALALATELDMPSLISDVRMTLGRLNQFEQLGAVARAELTETIRDARRRKDIQAQLVGLFRLGNLHYEYAEHEAAREAWERAAALARETGRPWSPFGFDARIRVATVDYVTGAWESALRVADHSGESPPTTCRAMLTAIELMVGAGRGEVSALQRLGPVRERWSRDGLIAVLSAGPAIELHGIRDGATAAVKEYDTAVEVLSGLWEPHFQARVRLAALALGQLAEASVATAERPATLATGDRLLTDAEAVLTELEERGRPFGTEGTAWMLRARAEHAHLAWRLDAPAAVTHAELGRCWEEALRAFESFGEVYEVARCRVRLGEVLRAAGDGAAADEQAAVVADVARRLGARLLASRVESTGRSASRPTALTPREREILALVAEGRSNGEIGRRLVISTKTVSVHVSNVLAKLGAASRTEAAAIAYRDGLLDS